MKIHGQVLEGPTIKECKVMYKGNILSFKFQSVLDFTVFDAICPEPQAMFLSGHPEGKTRDTDDADYIKSREVWALQRFHWEFLESISVTEDLEWETIVADDPDTWSNYTAELSKFLTELQISTLMNTMFAVNNLTQEMMDEAEDRFLAQRLDKLENVCSRLLERCFTLNGEVVSDLDLFLEEFENDGMIMDLGNEPS